MTSIAMSLYGGDHSAASANPYLTPHALHNSRLARNPIELQARRLPRPRKSRKKREKEKPLYPSIAAVEEAVPEAIISVQDNGTLDIRLPKDQAEEPAAPSSGAEDSAMDTEEEEEEEDSKPAAVTAVTSTPAAVARRKPQRQLRSSNTNSSSLLGSGRKPTSTSSSLLGGMLSTTTKPSRRPSNSSEKLDQAFRKLSVKRKPLQASPWPLDEEYNSDNYYDGDPLGGCTLTLAPRRKVSRQGSRDSLHSRDSRASADSGDSSSVSSSMSSVYLPTNHKRMPAVESSSSSSSMNSNDDSRIGSTLNLKTPSSTGGGTTASKNNTRSSAAKKSASGSSFLSSNNSTRKKSMRGGASSNDNTGGTNKDHEEEEEEKELEIEPGLFLPLRGTEETMAAIKTGFVEEIFCQSCDIELICIADANYCVCPECKCVSPVDGIASFGKKSSSQGSVGLGLRASSQR